MLFDGRTLTFPLQDNGYVDCPPELYYWFWDNLSESHWKYFDSPESEKDFTETVTVLEPYYDNFSGRTCYRKVQEERFDEELYSLSLMSSPDKLDACACAAYWLNDRGCDWVTPDWFLVPR